MSRALPWELELTPLGAREALGAEWSDLEARAEASFFQSWGWIGTWLACIGPGVRPEVLRARAEGHTVLLAVLARGRGRAARLLPIETLHLGETGRPEHDLLTVEHNGFLVERAQPPELLAAALGFLARHGGDWDELRLSGMAQEAAAAYLEAARRVGLRAEQEAHPFYYVDLEALRARGADHAASLSANSRYQLGRTRRRFAERGELRLELAGDAAEACAYLEALVELHQRAWQARGKPGAFAGAFMRTFHQRLVERRFEHGEVQLARASAGGEPFAYLYAFVHRRVVYSYQSGLAYGDDPRLRPGLLAHHLAIEHNLARGMRGYDLLAGDSRFKRSISTDEGHMLWLRLCRPRAAFALERALAAVRRRMPGR